MVLLRLLLLLLLRRRGLIALLLLHCRRWQWQGLHHSFLLRQLRQRLLLRLHVAPLLLLLLLLAVVLLLRPVQLAAQLVAPEALVCLPLGQARGVGCTRGQRLLWHVHVIAIRKQLIACLQAGGGGRRGAFACGGRHGRCCQQSCSEQPSICRERQRCAMC